MLGGLSFHEPLSFFLLYCVLCSPISSAKAGEEAKKFFARASALRIYSVRSPRHLVIEFLGLGNPPQGSLIHQLTIYTQEFIPRKD